MFLGSYLTVSIKSLTIVEKASERKTNTATNVKVLNNSVKLVTQLSSTELDYKRLLLIEHICKYFEVEAFPLIN